jgi:hypothetical protein
VHSLCASPVTADGWLLVTGAVATPLENSLGRADSASENKQRDRETRRDWGCRRVVLDYGFVIQTSRLELLSL